MGKGFAFLGFILVLVSDFLELKTKQLLRRHSYLVMFLYNYNIFVGLVCDLIQVMQECLKK